MVCVRGSKVGEVMCRCMTEEGRWATGLEVQLGRPMVV